MVIGVVWCYMMSYGIVWCRMVLYDVTVRRLIELSNTDAIISHAGFNISLTEEHMKITLQEVGCYVTTQFGNIAPADKVS